MAGLYILVELFVLSLLSSRLIQAFYNVFLLLFRSRTICITIVTFVLFPGTVIHELAHLFTAEILGVRTGKITLAPESIRGEEIQSGSVIIAQTDPIRRALIGTAPVSAGLITITALSYFMSLQLNELWAHWNNLFFEPSFYISLLIGYLLFAVSMCMFPSSVDMKGTPAVFGTLFVIFLAAYIVGFRVAVTGQIQDIANRIFTTLHQSLVVVLAINIALLLTMHILVDLIGKATHRRIVKP